MNLFLLGLLIVGHAEICATLINRSHSLRVHHDRLKIVRHFIDMIVISMPVMIIIFPGFKYPGLITGGNWSDLNIGWKLCFGFYSLGSLGFIYSILRWNCYRIPAIQKSNHTQVINIAKELNRKPVNSGHYSWMASIPGNQIFDVEFTEKNYALPIALKKNEELTILHLTDFHYTGVLDLSFYQKVLEHAQKMKPDMILFTGDLIDDSELCSWIPETLGKMKAPLGCYFILGNHDWYYDAEKTRKTLVDSGWTDVSSNVIRFRYQNTHLELGGLELPWMGSYPEFSDKKAHAENSKGENKSSFRILLSHSPDHFQWAQSQNVDLMLSGHNHGGQVILPVIGPVFAPSLFGVRYASGVFCKSGTLMSVLRGLSGVHPLRLNCRPEIVQYRIVSSLSSQE